MSDLLIVGGRIVDPSLSIDALRDLRIRDGRIAEIGEHLAPRDGERVLDARNAVVAPGFVDMHVHLREPGFSEKETVPTGTEAAVRGGFSAVACMPNTRPALDEPQHLEDLARLVAQGARCRVYPIAAITRARRGTQPCDYGALSRAGAVAFSDDGDTVENAGVLRAAAVQALETNALFISHCEDPSLRADAPALAEDVIVARDLLVAADTGLRWHIAHISTRGALELLGYARANGARATCEVTPHHLTFTSADAERLGSAARVNPPFRTERDLYALRNAVRDGTIDAFASDHAPHTAAEKNVAFDRAAPGFSSLEVAVGAYAAAIPDLPLSRFVELLSANPARILGIDGGTLAVGAHADVTLFADRQWRVDPAAFASKGTCTPFAGRTLPRKILATVVGGNVRYTAA